MSGGFFHSCSSTLENLMDESGCALEHPKAAKFRSHVLSGEWEQVQYVETHHKPLLKYGHLTRQDVFFGPEGVRIREV